MAKEPILLCLATPFVQLCLQGHSVGLRDTATPFVPASLPAMGWGPPEMLASEHASGREMRRGSLGLLSADNVSPAGGCYTGTKSSEHGLRSHRRVCMFQCMGTAEFTVRQKKRGGKKVLFDRVQNGKQAS